MNRLYSIPLIVLALLAALISEAPAQDPPEEIGTRPTGPAALQAPTARAAASPVAPFVTASGAVSLSVDAVGTNSPSGDVVRIDKPLDATVRAAFLIAASTGFSGYEPQDGDVTIGGASVSWIPTRTMTNGIGSVNVFADVTSQVRGAIDAAPAGVVAFNIAEGARTRQIDGAVFAVIFDDPTVTVPATVVLAYGAQQVTGDTIRLARTPDVPPADVGVTLGVGISFGFQPSNQDNAVEVNGVRLSTSAGGQDDGLGQNGALITVGGRGDTAANPADPFARGSQSSCPRCDDELYDLSSFVSSGLDSELLLTTTNPSADDNFFFASLEVVGATATWTPANGNFVYVALGDSFASGEGSDEFLSVVGSRYETGVNFDSLINDNTLTDNFEVNGQDGNACHRSLINYAKINAELLEPTLPSILVDRTCSGALVDPESGQPPITNTTVGSRFDTQAQVQTASQLNQSLWVLDNLGSSEDDVDLVTVSMGGNDAGFAKIIEACIISRVAREALDAAASDGLLRQLIAAYVKSKWANCEAIDGMLANSRQLITELGDKERRGHNDIANTFASARVFQINYPEILPTEENFPGDNCSGIHPGDADYALETADLINGIIADEIAASDARHPNSFEVVDISDRFGINPLCPADPSQRLANPIPPGAVGRIVGRLLDPSQEPGSFLAEAGSAKVLAQCAVTWVPGVNCYVDDKLDDFVDWVLANQEVIQGFLADVDPRVDPALVDAASFENFRGLFHPNEAGFATIACNVRAVYRGLDQTECDNTSRVDRLYLFDGQPVTETDPFSVQRDQRLALLVNAWDPVTPVEFVFLSDPVPLGTVTTDGSGQVTTTVTVPSDATAGVHRIQMIGTMSGGLRRVVTFLVEVPGVPVPGDLVGIFIDGLAPYEVAELTYLGTQFGTIQADRHGNAFVEVIVPDYALVEPVVLTVSGPTSGTQTHPVVAEVPDCGGLTPTIVGTGGDDVIEGTMRADVIAGLGGDDIIRGGNGNDVICGGAGNDEILGENGEDELFGSRGDDVVSGGNGKDIVNGDGGDDTLHGDNGKDELDGGEGTDSADGGKGKDTCDAETEIDCE